MLLKTRSKFPCLKTGKPHTNSRRRGTCKYCIAISFSRYIKTNKGKEYAKRKNLRQRGTTQKTAYRIICGLIKYHGMPKASEMPCLDCGKDAEVYDHRDYLKPYEFESVCYKCNYKRGKAKNLIKQTGVNMKKLTLIMFVAFGCSVVQAEYQYGFNPQLQPQNQDAYQQQQNNYYQQQQLENQKHQLELMERQQRQQQFENSNNWYRQRR